MVPCFDKGTHTHTTIDICRRGKGAGFIRIQITAQEHMRMTGQGSSIRCTGKHMNGGLSLE